MPSPPPIDLEALSLDDLQRLVIELLVRVTALEEENRALRDELAQARKVPQRPKLAPGGMDKATEPGSAAGGFTEVMVGLAEGHGRPRGGDHVRASRGLPGL